MQKQNQEGRNKHRVVSRRTFLRSSAVLAGTVTLGSPAVLHGQNLNERLNIAIIGADVEKYFPSIALHLAASPRRTRALPPRPAIYGVPSRKSGTQFGTSGGFGDRRKGLTGRVSPCYSLAGVE